MIQGFGLVEGLLLGGLGLAGLWGLYRLLRGGDEEARGGGGPADRLDGPRLALQSPERDGVVLTARSLFLNQEVSTFGMAPNHGTYSTEFELTDDVLRGWEGRNVLDVAGGAGLFPEEARELGINVDVVDLNHEAYAARRAEALPAPLREGMARGQEAGEQEALRGLETYRDLIAHLYVRNLEERQHRGVATPPQLRGAFDHIYGRRQRIAEHLYEDINRAPGNATDLADIRTNAYDVTLNSWMLNYLDENQRFAALQEFVRVTRPGGEIRMVAGSEGAVGSVQTGEGGLARPSALDRGFLERWADDDEREGIDRGPDEDTLIIGGKLVRIEADGADGGLLHLRLLRDEL